MFGLQNLYGFVCDGQTHKALLAIGHLTFCGVYKLLPSTSDPAASLVVPVLI